MKVFTYSPFLLLILFVSCRDTQHVENTSQYQTIGIDTLVVIGSEDQPFEYQLGDPFSVVTDEKGHIYVADRASLTVKVFDSEGNYLRSIGGRGRGPGEFMQINLMRPAGDGTLLFQDRGKLEFIYLNTDGEYLSSYPVDLSSQYYPQSVKRYKENSVGLYQKASSLQFNLPPIERPLFYVYDSEFREIKTSFFGFKDLGYTENEMFLWSSFIYYPGSFDLLENQNRIIYSPGVYTGDIYEFICCELGTWKQHRKVPAKKPQSPPYEIYTSDTDYERNNEIPGVNQIRFLSTPYWGRLYSIDTGIYYLENGKIVHFYGEWRGGDTTLDEGNTFDLFVQVIDPEDGVDHHGFINSLHIDKRPSVSLVNWKDEDDNFYLIDLNKNEVPKVIKFRLEFSE